MFRGNSGGEGEDDRDNAFTALGMPKGVSFLLAGGDDRDSASTASGMPEGVLVLRAVAGLFSPLEDESSLSGRRSDEPGVAIVAVILDIGRGVDSSSGRKSFSSSAVR